MLLILIIKVIKIKIKIVINNNIKIIFNINAQQIKIVIGMSIHRDKSKVSFLTILVSWAKNI